MNKKIPHYLVEKKTNFKILLFVTFFSLVFINVFPNVFPTFQSSSWYQNGTPGQRFIFSTISIFGAVGILILSRVLMYFINKKESITILQYCFWLIGEIVLIAIAYTIFNNFIIHDDSEYTDIFRHAILIIPMILFIPYLISYLYLALKDKEIKINDLLKNRHTSSNIITPSETVDNIIHFRDEKGALKLSIKQSCILYIESADNYVKVHYNNNNKIVNCIIRNSLKNMIEILCPVGFVRCHRSYIVNIQKVKVVRKEKDGIYIDLDQDGIGDIPISKSYYAEIMHILSLN